ncbi:AAA family ATPase, partial [Mycobacterium sp. MS3]
KTLSARHYSSWDTVRPIVEHFRFYETVAPEPALAVRTVFYTPKVHNTPLIVEKEVRYLHTRLSWAIETTLNPDRGSEHLVEPDGAYTELVIVDEADRLKNPALEALRDHHDRTGAGLILIG